MKLSPETRTKAVEAFKHEMDLAIAVLRKGLSDAPADWRGKEHKLLLHRLKGGAGFLGYTHLTIVMAELESSALTYPEDPKKWFNCLQDWESGLISLS